ncbi:FxSxx-COOH system tetratricopeptide repeat protein [Streptomyces mangrovisoli]|uniref:ATP-binding protein n=1 Tax=Streptomyces mangrovisoli TaxID=1428628 RepID=A0A1J4NQR8_9ACTN|nr:FxSxx-COOH system tetratricopeptide repeat protein [Streptomyces mangrovisoli]OIJ63589.1 ATP-binding protein [Streptomyces mangrovisoli]
MSGLPSFTISYAGFNRPWAVWIADQLERLGHSAYPVRWNPPVSTPLAEALEDLLTAGNQVVLVLDDWYFQLGPRSQGEWTEALRQVVPPNADRFAAVSVATQTLPTTAVALRPVDVRDLESGEARRKILTRLGVEPTAAPVNGDRQGPRFPNDRPTVFGSPRRNHRFTGREPILDRVHTLFNQGPGGGRVMLHGTSGVGKSQIAAEYAHRFGNHYDVVWWVNGSRRVTARDDFARLAQEMKLTVGESVGERIRAVHDALVRGTPHRRWLVIFDGVDEPEDIQVADLLPDGPGHVLITTRTRDWSSSGDAETIQVEPFDRDESIAYIRRRAKRLTNEEASDLAAAVQDLPLLLAQTAAYLEANPAMPARDYVDQIRQNPTNVGVQYADYPMSFTTAWSITFNTLKDKHPSAVELLKLFVFFSPDAIPVRLIQTTRPDNLPENLADLAADPLRWSAVLQHLSDATAVRLDYQSTPEVPAVETVQMHRLYHTFVRNTLTPDQHDRMEATAQRVLASATPKSPDDTREWARYAQLIPHLEFSGALQTTDRAVRELVKDCLECLKARGEYSSGLQICEPVEARWRSDLGPTHRDTQVVTLQHANMLRRLGRYHAAESVSRSLVVALGEQEPTSTLDLLRVEDNLAGTLMGLGAYPEALRTFEAVWGVYRRELGEEEVLTLQTRSNIGVALTLLGRYEEAAEIHRTILAFRERKIRSNHRLTLLSGYRYAWMLRLLGRYPEALSRQEQNVRRHHTVMKQFHPQTLLAEHNLALCMRRSGDLQGAADTMGSVWRRSVQVQGPTHPDALLVAADYATFTREHGDLDLARDLAEKVSADFLRLLGRDHPYSIGTRGNLGLVMWESGERSEALSYAERAFHDMAQAVGDDHPWALGCALNASGARNRVDDEEGAHALSAETLERAKRALGDTHPLTLSCKAALADDLRALRRTQEAGKLEQAALQSLSETLGSQHSHTLSVRRRERPYWDFEPQPT